MVRHTARIDPSLEGDMRVASGPRLCPVRQSRYHVYVMKLLRVPLPLMAQAVTASGPDLLHARPPYFVGIRLRVRHIVTIDVTNGAS